MTEGPAEAARRWLQAGHRTWRWNAGSYQDKNCYDAVETTDEGLLWFGFDGAQQGMTYRELQAYRDFLGHGPHNKGVPQGVLEELRAWVNRRHG